MVMLYLLYNCRTGLPFVNLSDMPFQITHCNKCSITIVAFLRLLPAVSFKMVIQMRLPKRRIGALVAFEGLFPAVCFKMLFQSRLTIKTEIALFAFE